MAAGSATALIVAAGSGQRLGAGGPKALIEVAGRPMYEWSVDACASATAVGRTIVAVPAGHEDGFSAAGIELVEGGATRSHSVEAGLLMVDTDYVVVHDAARPLVTPSLIDDVVAMLDADPDLDAVIAAAPVTDTVKRVNADGVVDATLDREELRSVQTPQVFRTAALRRAMAAGDIQNATDDAFLIESAGGRVGVLDTLASNIKVTVASDIDLAVYLLARQEAMKNPSPQESPT